MQMSLVNERCVACHKDAPPVPEEERPELARQIPDWDLIEVKGEPRLRRTYTFKDYETTLAFTQRVGELAIEQDHHPSILTVWGKVTVTWWTHAIHNLHRNDYIMAARCDAIYAQLTA
jgi:4a-hydroxytetrahydrobiopterin dehydratase